MDVCSYLFSKRFQGSLKFNTDVEHSHIFNKFFSTEKVSGKI